ncbi:hypothetical protein FRUB_03667 [Fimbriiglobus ruber]|uniref:Uncharacterized protein n=1 Tax=Fimbriiglobus ruber TaxID=1908690 RepID=A0A225DWM8_9BACT|nr:hypothetical protein FRUB_03667 [Fimbriiglobus ruber]
MMGMRVARSNEVDVQVNQRGQPWRSAYLFESASCLFRF